MANSLDKFRKGVAQWSGNIGSAGISDAVVKTVPLASTSGLPTDTAVMITVNRVDTNGKKTGNYEGIVGVVSGSNLIDCIRGVEGTAQAWTGGTVVEVLHTASNINELIDGILAEHNQDGTHKDTLVTSLKATGAVVNTGTSDVTIVTPKAIADSWLNNGYNSMARQAIINGNFDVWQRGISFTNPAVGTYTADRWGVTLTADGWTLPTTITHSRQTLASGGLPGSFYFYNINTNGAGSGTLGNTTQYALYYRIEHGTRYLCGNGKKVTFSIYANSSISNKKMIVSLSQRYGTGGSPTSNEIIKGTITTLTSTLTKYTYTFTTNTLSGKTFGTNNDDYLQIRIDFIWNPTYAATLTDDSASNETFLGSGDIDIAQVQLCAGDVALPFMPKSYEEELRACQRYCVVLNGGDHGSFTPAFGTAATTTIALCYLSLGVEMRTNPTLTATATEWVLSDGANNSIDLTDISIQSATNSVTSPMIRCTVASGLTQYRPYFLAADENQNRKMIFSAEL